MEYNDFIKDKAKFQTYSGFDIDQSVINPMLKPHQKDIVQWAIKGGCRAIFAAFGLGKSFIQLEILRIIREQKGGRQLIIAPLGVRQEFKTDAAKLNIDIQFVKWSKDVEGDGLYITNYESVRDGRLSVELFNAASLDEASILRSYGSKTFQTFLSLFEAVKYRFVATATPSPNRYKELIHYGGFLGVMDTGEALTRFFKRDSTKANNLQIHPHKEKEFWFWVSSWAIFLQRPSDLGYSDKGYDLPPVNVHYHEVRPETTETKDKQGQYLMFADATMSLQAAAKEKRESISDRIGKMLEIIKDDPDSSYIIWHDQEAERHAIQKALPSAKAVYGSQDLDIREKRIIGFSNGEFQYLSTKPVLAGSGCNFQRHCHKAIFLGIGFKFNDYIQSLHRIYRFLQTEQCEIHVIYSVTEIGILEILKQKEVRHYEMVDKMTEIITKYGLSQADMERELIRSIGVERIEASGKDFVVANNDCVDETRTMKANSVDLIHTSIPFSNHYEYTPSYNDFGHTSGNNHFWEQMDYLTPQLLRILKPGRIYACHVKDRILFGNVTGKGVPTVSPFHAETIFHCQKHGFDYLGMITVVTDVVRENNQTYRLGWTEQCKDATKMGVGSPEYVIIMRKPQTDRTRAYADEPVSKSKDDYTRAQWQVDAHSFWRSSGNRQLNPEEMAGLPADKMVQMFKNHSLETVYDYDSHIKIGAHIDAKGSLPSTFMSLAPHTQHDEVWTDVNRMLTLNGHQAKRNLSLHLCPLQFDIIDRIINRYSNPGELVFDPFGGLMSVPYRALKANRKGRAVELNPQYFLDGVKYLEAMEREKNIPDLFDFLNDDKDECAA